MTNAEYYADRIRALLISIDNVRQETYVDSIDEDKDYTDKVLFDAMSKLEYAANMVKMSNFND